MKVVLKKHLLSEKDARMSTAGKQSEERSREIVNKSSATTEITGQRIEKSSTHSMLSEMSADKTLLDPSKGNPPSLEKERYGDEVKSSPNIIDVSSMANADCARAIPSVEPSASLTVSGSTQMEVEKRDASFREFTTSIVEGQAPEGNE